jgi:small-conductance mechanosensitive channel
VAAVMSFWETYEDDFIIAAVSIGVLLGAYILYRVIKHAIERFSRGRQLAETDPGGETRIRMIQKLSAVAIFFIAIGVVFWVVDIDALNSVAVGMFASAGIIGIAIGFAAQTTMANLVSGVIIAFAQPIRLGDNVRIDGEYGAVESIGLFYTNIRLWDNRRLVIPNKLLSDQTIRNYTLVDPRQPAMVVLRLEYGADVETVRTILLDEARAHPLFIPDPEPGVQVVNADDLGVTVRLMAWTAAPSDAWAMAVQVREKVVTRLASADVPVGVRWSRIMSEPQA